MQNKKDDLRTCLYSLPDLKKHLLFSETEDGNDGALLVSVMVKLFDLEKAREAILEL